MSVSVSQIGIDRSLDRSIDQSRSPGQSLDQSICVYRCLYKEQHPLKRALTFAVKDPPPDRPLLSSHLIPTIFRALYTTCPQRCATSLIFCESMPRGSSPIVSKVAPRVSSIANSSDSQGRIHDAGRYTYENNDGRENCAEEHDEESQESGTWKKWMRITNRSSWIPRTKLTRTLIVCPQPSLYIYTDI